MKPRFLWWSLLVTFVASTLWLAEPAQAGQARAQHQARAAAKVEAPKKSAKAKKHKSKKAKKGHKKHKKKAHGRKHRR